MYPEKIKNEFKNINPKKTVEFKYHGLTNTRDADGSIVVSGPSVVYIPEEYDLLVDGEIYTIKNVIGTRDGKDFTEKIKITEAENWTITLDPNSASDLRKIHFLMNHPLNGDSKYREDGTSILFRQINIEIEESEEYDEIDKERVRLNKIDKMSESQLRDIVRLYKKTAHENIDDLNIKQLRLRVQQLTKGKNSASILERLDSRDLQVDITLEKAFDFNIVCVINNKICWGNSSSATEGYSILNAVKGKKPTESLKEYIASSKEGANIFSQIEKDLKDFKIMDKS